MQDPVMQAPVMQAPVMQDPVMRHSRKPKQRLVAGSAQHPVSSK